MKALSSLAGLTLSLALLFTLAPSESHAQRVAKVSQPGGVPVTLVVYNYKPAARTVSWWSFTGVKTPVGTAPSIGAGGTPTVFASFSKQVWSFNGPRGGGFRRLNGTKPVQTIIIGTAPAGAVGAAGVPIPAPSVKNVIRQPNYTTNLNITVKPGSGGPGQSAAPAANEPLTDGVMEDEADQALSKDDPEVVEFLSIHNKARAAVGVPPLVWSDDLSRRAQKWADKIADTGDVTRHSRGKYGENIAWGTGKFLPETAAKKWLAEKSKYKPGVSFNDVGHYTQMVWKKSTAVGFGIAEVNGGTVIVANYDPAGNIAGETPY